MPALKEEDTASRESPLDLQSFPEKLRAELQLLSQTKLQLYLPPALEQEQVTISSSTKKCHNKESRRKLRKHGTMYTMLQV